MELSLHIANFNWPGQPGSIASTLAATAKAAEEAGVAELSFMDHWFQMDQFAPVDDPMLEGYTSLGFMAAHTSTIKLGLLVTGVTYRYPGLLAKIVTTLDVLSGGRAQLGIGAAWYEREHLGLGVPFPPVTERFERLGDPPGLPPDVERRRRALRGQALPTGRHPVFAPADQPAPSEDPHRRQWGA
jgi:alkanesulfonate monooxygenase SsuD/methylene tetrahydromethanopterin reductase-like flavin-dependent oxidoreductase (luciferase family)